MHPPVGSGMDHLIHSICIPLMLPGARGMSANPPVCAEPDLRYRLSLFILLAGTIPFQKGIRRFAGNGRPSIRRRANFHHHS